MKSTFFLSFLILSFTTLADDTCFKVTLPNQDIEFLCGHNHSTQINLSGFKESDICFVGSAQGLVDKINAALFKTAEYSVSEGSKLSGYEVQATFTGPDKKSAKKVIHKCE